MRATSDHHRPLNLLRFLLFASASLRLSLLTAGVFLGALSAGFGQPVITSQPTNVYPSVSLGSRQALSVIAVGTPPLGFQWLKDGIALSGQTSYLLNFPSVQLTNLGLYTVVVTNSVGAVTSAPVRLDVDPTFTTITTGSNRSDRDGPRRWLGRRVGRL